MADNVVTWQLRLKNVHWAFFQFCNLTAILANKVMVVKVPKITLVFDPCAIALNLLFHHTNFFKFLNVAVDRIMTHPWELLSHVLINEGHVMVVILVLK